MACIDRICERCDAVFFDNTKCPECGHKWSASYFDEPLPHEIIEDDAEPVEV